MFEDQNGTYSDSTIHCPDCNQDFTWTAGEKKFFDSKQLTSPPKRCKPCRDAKKESRGNATTAPAAQPTQPYGGEDRGNERHGNGGGGKNKGKKNYGRGGNGGGGYSHDSGRAKQAGKMWGEDSD